MKQKIFSIFFLLFGFFFSLNCFSQTLQTITGVVKTEQGEAVPMAYVKLLETQKVVLTNAQGSYTIKASLGQTLQVSYIGMKTVKKKITTTNVNFFLQENTQIEEAVVTGYQKIKSRVFTGAASSVKMDAIKLDGVADISRMLEGRVAGLSIQNISGSFGAAPRINIRGGASILGNVQPLWVIDGAVYEDLVSLTLDQLASGDAVTLISSAVAGLNPSDIEDIQVLKDASATSIYGARALNGVIVITTKSGKRNAENKFSYSFELSLRDIPSYRNYDLLNSQETMSIYQEMNNKGYFSLANTLYGRRSGVYYELNHALTTINPQTGEFLLSNTPEAKANFLRMHEYANTDWFKYLFPNRPIQSHTLTFTGGSENNTLYASLGLYEDMGWTLTDRVRRITANLKNNFYWNDKWRTTITAQANVRQQKAVGTMPQRKNMVIGSFERDFDINPYAYAVGTSRTLTPYEADGSKAYYRNNWTRFNILEEYANNYMNTHVIDFKIQGDLSYWIQKGLELKATLAMRKAVTETQHTIHEQSNVIQAYQANTPIEVAQQNIYLLQNQEDKLLQPEIALKQGGIYNKIFHGLDSYMARIALDYDKQIDEHNIRAFGFAELRSADRVSDEFSGYGIQYDRGNQVEKEPLIFKKIANEGKDYFSLLNKAERGITFSANATYGYKGRYIFNTVVNYEGSNTAGKGSRSRWLPTWNIGGKWNIDQEYFMKEYDYISKLAFRVSYGLTAKMNEQAINSLTVYKNALTHRPHLNSREKAIKILHLENQDLTWEKMYELNLGIELGLWNNRISTTLDVYQRNSFDLIDLIRTSGVGGEYYKYANFGDMSTLGAELSIQTKNIEAKNFSWISTFTLSAMHQKITRLLNRPNAFDMVSGTGKGNIVGYPRGSLFSFNFQQLNDEGLPTFDFGLYPLTNHPHKNITGADFLDAQYTKTYLIYHGSIEPKYLGGIGNTFKYKQWDLSFFVTIQGGNKIRLNPTFDPSYLDLNVFSHDYLHRWLNPGDQYKTQVPVIPSQELIQLYGAENIERSYNTYNYSQLKVADGSFVRMKNISLGYNLSEKIAKRIHISGANLRVNMTNPFLIYADSKLKGQDPEYYKSGGVSLPTPKQFTFTLNLQF